MTSGADIVRAGRSWLGTRFAHQGRLKKTVEHAGGVDCLGLLVGVAEELGLRGRDGSVLVTADEPYYPHNPDTKHLMKRLGETLHFIPHEGIEKGDVVVLRIDDSPQHLAIISDYQGGLGIIHAYAPARAVVEHALDEWWHERIEVAFRL